jgi:hypothetical protein
MRHPSALDHPRALQVDRPSRWEVLVHDSLEGTGALPSNRILNSMRSTAHAAVNRLLRHLKPKFLDELAGSGVRDQE